MKVGIYNAHVNTMGGGEKHMGSIAEYFSKKNNVSVDIITHKSVDLEVLSSKLKLDLKKCNLVVTNKNAIEIEDLSSDYDLFINTTYLSTLKPMAKKNILIMFFPIIPFIRILSSSKIFRNFIVFINSLDNIKYKKGFYHKEKIGKYFRRKFGNWTNKNFSFSVFADKKNKNCIHVETLAIGDLILKKDIESIFCNGRSVNFEVLRNVIKIDTLLMGGDNIIDINLRKVFKPSGQEREVGIFVKNIYTSSGFICLVKNITLRVFEDFRYFDHMNYYDSVFVISEYTQKWLKKIWRTESEVLYPLVEVEEFFNDQKKERSIISVGRFFIGNHNKKHIPMIKAFKKMYDSGLLKGWEYNICGGTHPEIIHQKYLADVKKEAEGYPIHIYPDIPFDDLKKVYAKSTIFWHAAGHGENEKRDPDKFEHFGITTVESMAAGCIPVVIGKAGQIEIVSEGKDGFLWKDIDELEEKMKIILRMKDNRMSEIRKNTINRAEYFSRDNFFSELDNKKLI